MTDPGFALQKAIIATLRADSGAQTYLGTSARIYDDPPRDTAFPYVSLGPGTLSDNDTSSERGHVHSLVLDVWSRQGGRKEVRAIIGAIEAALHDRVLTLDGHLLINLRFEFADIFRDVDGETMRGTVRYRAVTEPL
jgi:hypothetical protein